MGILMIISNKLQSKSNLESKKMSQTQKNNVTQEDVSYNNEKAGITLAGTLTLPKTTELHPAVLLITGYGKQERDCQYGHKKFKVLAEYLTNLGLAVLRYDKRGAGKSTGIYNYDITSPELADDAIAGIEYLKSRNDIDPNKIGVIGHSEGGMIAAMIASERSDLAFMVSLAGLPRTSLSFVQEQTELQLRADGASEELINQNLKLKEQLYIVTLENNSDREISKQKMQALFDKFWQELPEKLKQESLDGAGKFIFAMTSENAKAHIGCFNSLSYRYFFNHDPARFFKKITIPVLALNGSLDFIVIANKALPAIAQSLEKAGNKDVTIKEIPNVNHTLQTCKTGAISEFATLTEPISPALLEIVGNWICKRV